jgi:hypothetical protein
MNKDLIGKKVRLIPTPKDKYSSTNLNIRDNNNQIFIVERVNSTGNIYINNLQGNSCGFVYNYEFILVDNSIEDLKNKIKEYESLITENQAKLKYLMDTCQTEFDEEAYNLHLFLRNQIKKDINLTELVNNILEITK